MASELSGVSSACQTFLDGAPKHAGAWMDAVRGLDGASGLDRKNAELAYLAVLAAFAWNPASRFTPRPPDAGNEWQS